MVGGADSVAVSEGEGQERDPCYAHIKQRGC